MSRANPRIIGTVPATLTGEHNYEVSAVLHIREVWGHGVVWEGFVLERERLVPVNSAPIESGVYLLDYEYGGKHIQKPI
ncbi:MAG: hypothetical protein WB660_13980 [Candidatus Sulfotelmatobacter sp.]